MSAMLLRPAFRLVAFELPSPDPAHADLLPAGTLLATLPLDRLGSDEAGQREVGTRLGNALAARNCRLLVKGVESDVQAAFLARAGLLTVPPG